MDVSDAPLRVAAGQVNTLVGLTWRAGAPTLALVAPDGQVYTRAAPGAQDSAFVSARGQRLPGGAVGAVALLLPHPLPGQWRVRIGNLRGGEGYHVEVRAERPAAVPSLRVLRPAAGQRLVTRPAAPSVVLAGTLSGAPAGSAVSLFYTSRPTLRLGGQVVPNTTGTLIADPVPVRGGRWSYRWDTSAVPSGTYDVYATLDSGAGGAVTAFAGGTVRVEQPAHPEAPRAVVALALPHNGSLEALWAPPVRAALLAGYRLHWRLLPARQARGVAVQAGRWRTLDVGLAQSADLGGLTPGRAYQVAVSAYDSAGHESARATARTLVLPRLAGHPHPAQRHAPHGHAQQGSAPHQQGPHRSASRRSLPGASFALGASGIRLVAGGDARLPLRVRPHGRARADGGDYVELSVAGAPDGLLAQLAPSAVNLFAQGQGTLVPALQIVTSPTLPPGRYTLRVTARQHLSRRVVVARVRVVVTPGAARPYSGGRRSQADGAISAANGRQVGALPSVRLGLQADRFGAYRVTTAGSGASLRVGRPIAASVARRLSVVRIEPIATLRWARGAHPHALLADDGTTCGDSSAGTNRLAGTPYEDAHWTLPGTDRAVPVGTLDDTLPHNGNPRTTNTYYGPLDYVYGGAKEDVLLTLGTPDGDRGQKKYYDPGQGKVGRATGMIAILTPASVKPVGASDSRLFFDPPGFEDSDTHSSDPRNANARMQRGHLRGDVFYGSSRDAGNFVALYKACNQDVMGQSYEKLLAGQLRSGVWTKVYYRVVPHYASATQTPLDYMRPISIEIEAIEIREDPLTHQIEDSNDFHVSIPNFGTVTKDDVQELPPTLQ